MSFFLTMFIGGPLLGYLLLRVAGVWTAGRCVCFPPFRCWRWW